MPEGMLLIAKAPARQLRQTVEVLARWSYPTRRGGNDSKPLVPGVPEASDWKVAVDAVIAFRRRVEAHLARTPKGKVVAS